MKISVVLFCSVRTAILVEPILLQLEKLFGTINKTLTFGLLKYSANELFIQNHIGSHQGFGDWSQLSASRFTKIMIIRTGTIYTTCSNLIECD
jgi:hypothetical protein